MGRNHHQECEVEQDSDSTNDEGPNQFLASEKAKDVDGCDIQGKEKGSVDEDKEEEREEAEEEVSQDDDIDIEKERRKSYHRSPQYSRSKRYREITKLTIKLIIHFLAVLVVLFGGAVVFAYLEDGEYLLAD